MEEPHYKVVMLGDSGVGKTALVNRISEGVFTEAHVPTVGSQFIALPLEINKTKITLELWDTAGQEVYRSLVGFYTREAKGAFLVFDVTNEQSYVALNEWIKFANEATPGVKLILFANKIDLASERRVSAESIQQFAEQNHVELIEGSAKTGQGTQEAFERMGELMLSMETTAPPPISITPEANSDKKKKDCC